MNRLSRRNQNGCDFLLDQIFYVQILWKINKWNPPGGKVCRMWEAAQAEVEASSCCSADFPVDGDDISLFAKTTLCAQNRDIYPDSDYYLPDEENLQ